MTQHNNAASGEIRFGPVNLMPGISRGHAYSFLGSATLIGQEAPELKRGSVVRVFNGFVLLAAIAVRILSPGPMNE